MDTETGKKKIIEILEDIRPDLDFETEDKLIDERKLDSIDIITLVTELNEQFDISINVNHIAPVNLNNVQNMWDLVCTLKSG